MSVAAIQMTQTSDKSKKPENLLSEVERFELDGKADSLEDFQLEALQPSPSDLEIEHAEQPELFLPERNPEAAPDDDQLELKGLEKPIHALQVEGIDKPLTFHYANNLLESLEAQDVQVPYQCREGYCGGCRTDLVEGEVAYLQEPMAWINEGEILPCCCVPKTPLKLKLKG